jgi:hypothetical protein
MDLFHFFWDARQDRRLNDVQSAARRASNDLSGTNGELADLRAAVDRLALVNQSLWELVRERTNLTDADLEQRVKEVDLRDGRADGRMSAVVRKCAKCGRPNRTDRERCLYCDGAL